MRLLANRFSDTRAGFFLLLALPLLIAGELHAAEVVDAREFGCVADYQKIECGISAEGSVTRVGGTAFAQGDVGKVLIIDAARSWPMYSADAVALNARITGVEGGVATVVSIDDAARGTIVANAKTSAEFFTDNTDAIAKALAAQVVGKLSHVLLPDGGVIGLCPFVSETWKKNPIYDSHMKTRAMFVMKDGAVLKGHGKTKTRLKIGYFGEFEPVREARWFATPIVFMFEPVEGKKTRGEIAGFTLEFPYSPVVMSGYSFVVDCWNVSPARHALQVTLRDIATINPERNTVSIHSSFGGIYGPDNALIEESKYVIENCDFETAGGSFKNQNSLKANERGGKSVYFNNMTVHGGGNIITRHYQDCASIQKVGDAFYLNVDQKDFTWKNFNAHSDQSEGAYNPACVVRKAHKTKINSMKHTTNGVYAIEGGVAAPVTKTGLSVLINFGLKEKQIYLEGVASLAEGSATMTVNLNHAQMSAELAKSLVGAEIRVYYQENLVKGMYSLDAVRRTKLNTAQSPDLSLLGETGLDVTVNFEGARGAFGHTFYVGHNINFYVNGLQIYECAKRSFRVSEGGSAAADGAHELTDYKVHPARGMAAFCNRTTVFAAAEEFGGLLKLRRSSASSVYGVVLDMDEGSTYTAQGGIYGPSVIRNSTVYGSHYGGGKSIIENSTVGLRLARISPDGNSFVNSGVVDAATPQLSLKNCKGQLAWQNGIVEAEKSQLQLEFMGDSAQYEQWKTAIRGTWRECEFTGPARLQNFTAEQKADWEGRQVKVKVKE